jgi:hypothetical protein
MFTRWRKTDIRRAPAEYEVTRAEAVAAAQVRVALDRRWGRETEQWIVDLAAEEDDAWG